MTLRLLTGSMMAVLVAVWAAGCSSEGTSASYGSESGGQPRYLAGNHPFDQIITVDPSAPDQPRRLYLVVTDHSDQTEAGESISNDRLTEMVLNHVQSAWQEAQKAGGGSMQVVFFFRHDPGDATLGRTLTLSNADLKTLCSESRTEARNFITQRAGDWPEMYLPATQQ
jgi:hypothetical protein